MKCESKGGGGTLFLTEPKHGHMHRKAFPSLEMMRGTKGASCGGVQCAAHFKGMEGQWVGEFYLFRETETNGKYYIKETKRRLLGTEYAPEGERGAGEGKKLTHIGKKKESVNQNMLSMSCR